MFYLWRVNPEGTTAIFVGSFDKFKSAKKVVLGLGAADGLKVVQRPTDQGLQVILKSHETTLEALVHARIFFITNNPQRPVVRQLAVQVGERPLNPGDGIPRPIVH